MCKGFERLPILANAELLRNIIYSGVWTKFYAARRKELTLPVSSWRNIMTDPYKVLGVSRDASDDEVKKHTEH